MIKGTFFGIGVGPGDPLLMTLKAVKTIDDCPVIAFADTKSGGIAAYDIINQVCKDMDKKTIVHLPAPMNKDFKTLEENYKKCALKIAGYLDKGMDVAFPTIGDPSIYSTYIYFKKYVENLNYTTSMVPGVPSFCAVSSRLNISLGERMESIHILPSSYGDIKQGLALKGVKILMKSGSKIGEVKKMLLDKNANVKMVENCGMKNETVYNSLEEIPDSSGYFSTFIVRDREE